MSELDGNQTGTPLTLNGDDLNALMRGQPSLPAVQQPAPELSVLARAVQSLKEIIETREGRRGSVVDKALTWRDLFTNGITQFTVDGERYWGNPAGMGGNGAAVDLGSTFDATPPPAPEEFAATGAFTTIILTWKKAAYSNHSHAEVWRSATNDLTDAVLLGTSQSSMYVDATGNSATYYYWVRFVSTSAVTGPYNGTVGTMGQTSDDPSMLLDLLSGQITASQLHSSLGSRIDLIDAPENVIGSVAYRVSTEASTRAAALLTEAQARANADTNLQTQLNMVVAGTSGDLSEVLAALQEEQTARTNADGAEATARETLATQMRGNYTGTDVTQLTTGLLYSERTARSSADSALSSTLTALQATVTNNYSTLNAAIQSEQTARANADTAEATSRDTLAAQIRGTYTGSTLANVTSGLIYSERVARADADSALSTRIDTLTSTVNGNTSAITTEQTTRANADSALSTQINTVSAVANARITTFYQSTAPTAKATGDLWFDTANNNAVKRWNGTSWAAAEDTRLATNAAAIQSEATARANGDSANATAITTLQTTVNGHTTSIQTQQSSVDGLKAQVFTKIDNNGYVTGYGLDSTVNATGTPSSTFAIRADKFYIANPAGPGIAPAMPFYVQTTPTTVNGVSVPVGVYITDAFIVNGSITNAKIGNAAIDDAKIANLSASKITAGDIDAARMSANIVTAVSGKFSTLSAITTSTGTLQIGSGGYIRSNGATAYGTGVGFWMGDDAGTHKFRIGDPTGHQLSWDGSTLTIKGALNGATGTFSGSLSAATGTFRGGVMSGQFTGWAWPAAGNYGFYLGPEGLLMGNYNNGKYVYITSDGTFGAPGLSIANGSATFSGSLSAANGTFSGTLTASAINAVNTINIAGNAVTIPISAFTASVSAGGTHTLPISSTGAPIAIFAWAASSGGASPSCTVRLSRDGVVLATSSAGANAYLLYVDTPGAGYWTYTITKATSSAGGPLSSYIQETKR